MEDKSIFRCVVFGSIIVALAGMTVFGGLTLQNGDFSAGLSGWTVEYGDVTDGGGYALFQEHPIDLSSTLSQEFTLPPLARELSFDMVMSAEAGGDYDPFSWPDAFTASLYDNPTDLNPLVSNSGVDDFFYLDNTGYWETAGIFDGTRVSLDVSGFRGMNTYLVFDLWGGTDGMLTNVSLDNVNISVIPAPAALFLGLIGTGLVGIIRKSKVGKLI
jgi:hypothetical protein